jgi:hypothetical protein
MSYVTIDRQDGGYTVSRHFRNLPAAMRGVDALLGVNEAAHEPLPKPEVALPAGIVPHEAATVLQAALERAEADDPPPHDGRSPWPADEE